MYCEDGAGPYAGLVQGTDGNFYSTTYAMGVAASGRLGDGTVFKITPGGTVTTLHIFCPVLYCTEGGNPVAGLVQGTDGNFYGTIPFGGNVIIGRRCGRVFTITPDGTLTYLYNFCSQGNCLDGDAPVAGLVQATDGNFYGTTYDGGANNYGTVFKITPSPCLLFWP
jgi:uncharacterized repeat protein (TIGR03803 family)